MKRKNYKDLSESQKQHVNQKLVGRVIYVCASSVVDFILQQGDNKEAPFCWDDVENSTKKDTGDVKDILEWWYVDPWYLEKLRELDEAVIPSEGIWGRTTSGQSIVIDWVTYKIAETLWDEEYYFNNSDFTPDYFEEVKKFE